LKKTLADSFCDLVGRGNEGREVLDEEKGEKIKVCIIT
jgi:hypothetical protein